MIYLLSCPQSTYTHWERAECAAFIVFSSTLGMTKGGCLFPFWKVLAPGVPLFRRERAQALCASGGGPLALELRPLGRLEWGPSGMTKGESWDV